MAQQEYDEDGNSLEMETTEQRERREMPDSLANFIAETQPEGVYSIVVTRMKGEGRGILRRYGAGETEQAEVDSVGREFGSGCYQWKLSWVTPKGLKRTKTFSLDLAGDYYDGEHAAYLREKAKRDAAKLPAAAGGAPSVDIGELVKNQLGNLKDMAELMRAPAQAPAVDNTLPLLMQMMQQNQIAQAQAAERTQTMLLGLVGALAPVVVAFIQKPKAEAAVNPMGAFKEVFEMARGIVDVKSLANPPVPEKESVAERIVTMVSDNLPAVLEVVAMKASERNRSLTYIAAKNSAEVKAAEADPAVRLEVAEKMASRIGLVKTRDIVRAMGWEDVALQLDEAIAAKSAPAPAESPVGEAVPAEVVEDD